MFVRLVKNVPLIGFLLLISAGPASFMFLDSVKTRASRPAPAFSWGGLQVGSFTAELEEFLRDSSPLVRGLRSLYALPLMKAGLLESPRVRFGPAPWLFYRPATRVGDPAALARLRSRRLSLFTALQEEMRGRNIELVVLLVPDKSRVYADLCYGEEGMPAAKAGLYSLILSELGEAGIRVVELLGAFREHRQNEPDDLLYYPGDTHWTPAAMRIAARRLAEELAAADIRLRRQEAQLIRARSQTLARSPDLVDLLAVVPSWLAEYGQPQAGLRLADDSPRAAPLGGLALAGGSFSERGFAAALAEVAGEAVEASAVVPARGPLAGLRETAYLIRQGRLRPRILVWEFVERSYLESQFWLRGPAELGLR